MYQPSSKIIEICPAKCILGNFWVYGHIVDLELYIGDMHRL